MVRREIVGTSTTRAAQLAPQAGKLAKLTETRLYRVASKISISDSESNYEVFHIPIDSPAFRN